MMHVRWASHVPDGRYERWNGTRWVKTTKAEITKFQESIHWNPSTEPQAVKDEGNV